jgi:hypothetical protein
MTEKLTSLVALKDAGAKAAAGAAAAKRAIAFTKLLQTILVQKLS